MIVPALYALADCDALGAEQLPAAVEAMGEAGVGWVQVRAKGLAGGQLQRLVAACQARLAAHETLLWIDDRVDLAALSAVGGVHLGQRDLPPAAARRLVGESCLIGFSTHDMAQLAAADRDPAVDVIALGPIFATVSKTDAQPVVGLDTLRCARRLTQKPLVAIGGIDAGNVAAVLAAGADTAAVLSAVCRGDVASNCARLLAVAKGAAR